MNISLVAVGTRGDVEPHMALAAELAARGHQVTLAAPVDFERRAQPLGVTFHPIDVRFREIYSTKEGAALLACENKSLQFIRQLKHVAVPIAERLVSDIRSACIGADAVYYSILGVPAYYIARDMGIPAFATSLQPMGRTKEFPSPLYPFSRRLPGRLNLTTHLIVEQVFWQVCRALMKTKLKTELPLWGHFKEIYRSGRPMLFGYSPSVIPRPADYEPWMHVTGFWRLPLESGWKPPAALAAFLSVGPPPICIGFGSMNSRRIDAILPTVLRAISEAGRRAIVLTGWWDQKNVADLPANDVYVTESVPHSWLFPKVAAVVHHGGAGTTAAALSAGVPSIVVPFFFDQWFWGQSLYRLGLGPEPISLRNLTPSSLEQTLEAVENSSWFRQRLGSLSRQLRHEDGAGNAVDVIEEAWNGRGRNKVPVLAE